VRLVNIEKKYILELYVQYVSLGYRCPNCNNANSINVDKIYNGRLMFACSKCSVCGIVPAMAEQDEAYLEFLSMYDNGHIDKVQNLESVIEEERLVRPLHEIKELIHNNDAVGNKLLENILKSRRDYIVDYMVLEEPEPEAGHDFKLLDIDEAIVASLYQRNIHRLYKFQEESILHILEGKDVAIVAPTASGKTEAFCIPIVQKISVESAHFSSLRAETKLNKRSVSAIFVYPTKALARDQLPKIKQIAASVGLNVGIFDGDTSKSERELITRGLIPEIIVTNFDVIHYHLLHKTKFSRLLRTCKFLVVDEAHVYTGVFGANVHYIIKRLERMTSSATKQKLQIIAASATLPNANEFCGSLFGRDLSIVYGKGRKGKINLVVIFPSLHSQRSLMLEILKRLITTHHKTIAFSKSHLGSELLAFYSTKQGNQIRVHRAGLLPSERKSVEDLFRNNKIVAISATPTLELGIDIGDVDAIISDIVPVNRLIQRLGRAARNGQEGYAFLALGNDPISQYYKLHPEDYLQDQEIAYTDPTNTFVEEYQVLAMACDKPISMNESFPIHNTLQKLISVGLIQLSGGKFVPELNKALNVLWNFSIRGIGSRVDIIFNEKKIGERQMPQAIEELHDQAIYFLGGKRYKVTKLYQENADNKQEKDYSYAKLAAIPGDYPYYTKAIVNDWPTILEVYETKTVFGLEVKYCSLEILKKVSGYSNIELGKEATQGTRIYLEDALEFKFITKGLVFRAPKPKNVIESAAAGVNDDYLEMSGYHATEHVIIEGSIMITGGSSQDMGGISLGSTGLIFIYDGSIGGNGASRTLYEKLDKAILRAQKVLSECPCKNESGCPRCTFSYKCGNNNDYLHKMAGIEILNNIVASEKTIIGEQILEDKPLV
jgi:DEAD/DEAH box helicase domain-containing protein